MYLCTVLVCGSQSPHKSHEIAAMCYYSDPHKEDNVTLVLAEECWQLACLQ